MIVLNPEGKARTAALRVPVLPRFPDLHGKVVGFLDNSKPNTDMLQEHFEKLLKQSYNISSVVRRRKLSAQQGAPTPYLEELAAQADFIISGLGD
jgi:hypothetical protein